MSAYDNDPRVHVRQHRPGDINVTYTIRPGDIPVPHPYTDVYWHLVEPGDSLEVKFIRDGGTVNGWVVEAVSDRRVPVRLTGAGAYVSVDAALNAVFGESR